MNPSSDSTSHTLDAEHAKRIAWSCVFDAIWQSRNSFGGVTHEDACSIADAYTDKFIEKVETYTNNFNAAEELKRRV